MFTNIPTVIKDPYTIDNLYWICRLLKNSNAYSWGKSGKFNLLNTKPQEEKNYKQIF